jgi:hypothetical protein
VNLIAGLIVVIKSLSSSEEVRKRLSLYSSRIEILGVMLNSGVIAAANDWDIRHI